MGKTSSEHRRFKRGAASIGARFRGSGTSYNGFSENFLGDGTIFGTARQRWQRNRIAQQRGDVREDDLALVIRQFEPPTSDEHVMPYDPTVPINTWIAQTLRMV